jgi:hypothetical protein
MSDPTLALTTDKQVYTVGETINVTAAYTDEATETETLTISGTATDSAGNTVTATTVVTVNSQTPQHMDVAVTDNDDRTYTQVSDDPGVATFTATA